MSQGVISYTLCANGTVPAGYTLIIKDDILTSFQQNLSSNITLSRGELFYNGSFVNKVFDILQTCQNDTSYYKDELSAYSGRVRGLVATTDVCLGDINKTQEQNNMLSQHNINLQSQYSRCNDDYTKLKDNPYGNDVRIMWASVGVVLTFVGLILYFMWQGTRTPHNEGRG